MPPRSPGSPPALDAPPSPVVPFALALAAGLAAGRSFSIAPLAAGGLALLAAGESRWRIRARGALAGLLLAHLAIGGAPGGIPGPVRGIHLLRGRVLSVAPPHPAGVRAVVSVVRLDDRPWDGPPVELRSSLGGTPDLLPGDLVEGYVRLAPRIVRHAPGAAPPLPDAPPVLARATGTTPPTVVERPGGPAACLAAARAAGARRLAARLPPDDAGLARALLLGDRGRLSDADRRRFRETGQGHLLAVSGLHVGLFVGGLLVLLAWAGMGRRPRALVALAAVLVYVPLAGGAPSALRAGLGATVAFLGVLAGRRISAPAALATVALFLLLGAPARIERVALLLSLSAVVGIVLLSRPILSLLLRPRPRIVGIVEPEPAWVRRALAVSVSAWLATAPLLASLFARLSPVAALVSLLTIPLTALLVGFGFALLLLPGGGAVAALAAAPFAWTARALRDVLDGVLRLGLGARPVATPTLPWILAYGSVLLALGRGRRRPTRAAALGGALLLLALLFLRPRPTPPEPRLVVLPATRGWTALFETPVGDRWLLLGGGSSATADARRVPVALRALAIDEVPCALVLGRPAVRVPDLLSWSGQVRLGTVVLVRDAEGPEAHACRRRGLHVEQLVPGLPLLEGPWGHLDVVAAAPGGAGGPRLGFRLPGRPPQESFVLPGPGAPDPSDAIEWDLGPPGPRARRPWEPKPSPCDALPLVPRLASPDVPVLHLAVVAFLVLFAILASRVLRWLTAAGAGAAAVLGALAWFAFGPAGLAALFAPFVVATLLGRLPGGAPSERRSARQVIANGIPALAGALAALAGLSTAGLALFLGGLATLGADTVATEVGTRYGGRPFALVPGCHPRSGESGGVTPAGLLASLGGAWLAPGTAGLVGHVDVAPLAWIAFAGVAGGLLDSLLGATLQFRGRDPSTGAVTERTRRPDGTPLSRVSGLVHVDNDVVNLASGLAGALLAWLLVGV